MTATGNPGDVVLYRAMLGGSFGGTDISSRLLGMSVFHDLQKPYSSVVLTIQDVAGMLNGLALDGTQTFSVSFGQPPDQPPYEGEWVLTTLEKVRGSDNQRVATFTATGHSPHMLNLKRVQRSFRDVPMHSAISTLVHDVLSPKKPFVVRAPARNMTGDRHMPYTINGQQVFKAIKQLMTGSASSVDKSSAYVMFEQHKNLVLDTLENISKSAGRGPTYYQRQLGTDFLGDAARQQFTILAAREEARADAAATAQDASQAVNVVDLFSTKFKNELQQFGALGNMLAGLGGSTAGGKASSIANVIYNSMRVPSFMQDVVAARTRVASQFDQQALTLTVMLNPALEVGGGVSAEMSIPSGDTNETGLDRVSGPLVITQLRHTLDLRARGAGSGPMATSSFRACKGTNAYNEA